MSDSYDPMDYSPPGSSVHGDSPGKNTGVSCHVLLQGIFPTQGSNSGLPLCRQILYQLSYQGSPRILEWVVYSFSRGSSQPRCQTDPVALQVDSLPSEPPWKPMNTGLGSRSLSPGDLSHSGIKPGSLAFRQILATQPVSGGFSDVDQAV